VLHSTLFYDFHEHNPNIKQGFPVLLK